MKNRPIYLTPIKLGTLNIVMHYALLFMTATVTHGTDVDSITSVLKWICIH